MANVIPPANGTSLVRYLETNNNNFDLTGRLSHKFLDTIHGYADFFFQLYLHPPYTLRSQGDISKPKHRAINWGHQKLFCSITMQV